MPAGERTPAAAVQLRRRVPGQVVEARGEEAVADAGGVERHREPARVPEPVAEAGCQPHRLRLRRRGRRVRHAQRVEDGPAQVRPERLAGDRLHQRAEDHVVGVAVVVRPAGLADRRKGLESAHRLGEAAGRLVVAVGVAAGGGAGQAAGVGEQLPHGDPGGDALVGQPQPGQVPAGRVVEPDPPVLHEPHHGQRGERLGGRPDHGRRVAGDRPAVAVDAPGAARRDGAAAHHRVRQPGHPQLRHPLPQVRVDASSRRRRGRGRRDAGAEHEHRQAGAQPPPHVSRPGGAGSRWPRGAP